MRANQPNELQATSPNQPDERSCWQKSTHAAQDGFYQLMARTALWDCIVSGFHPGREYAFEQLDIQPTDRVLLIGIGSGTDFMYLPSQTNKANVSALDYASRMVAQAKVKARELGIPEENVFVGDAQQLSFTTERFDKIFFPLSLASIPDPQRALAEAERVLAPNGKIALFEKLIDDGHRPSAARRCLNTLNS